MSSLSRLQVEHRDDAVIVRVEGDIDLANAHEVRSALESAPAASSVGMVVDLSSTGYVDSSGVAVLVGVAQEFSVRRQRVLLAAPRTGAVRRVLDIVQIDQLAPVYDSVDEALAALRES